MILTANEMPCWYYDKKDLKNTPSIRDEIDYETERRYRREGARFIMQCGTEMGLGHNTIATGVVYFHRFYMFQSFHTFPRYVTGCCCLFLAGKVEETPKKCKDIIKQAKTILSDQKFVSFGEDPKEEVMTLERILLQTIKFDLQVDHPYSFLVKYAKCLKGDQLKLEKMVQMAWNFVNDSLSTTVCLQWEPEIIAVALIHLASKLSKFTVIDWVGRQSNHFRWWDMFVADVTMPILEDICHQVLDLYQQSNVSSNIHNNTNTNNNANINSNNSNQTDGNESPPQLPASKASPPIKRDNIPPVFKTSPQPQPIQIQIQQPPQTQQLTPASITQHQKQQQQLPAPSAYTQHNMSIDEKIETHEIQRLSMADNHMHYNYPPAPAHAQSFNSMYMHPSYSGGPSSLMPPNMGVQGQQSIQQPLHQPPTQSSAYQYNTMPPQPIMGHYQSAAPPPMHAIHGSHPPHQQNYYQQPPVRGGYYPPH